MRKRMTKVIHGSGFEKMWQSVESWEKWRVLLLLLFALAKTLSLPLYFSFLSFLPYSKTLPECKFRFFADVRILETGPVYSRTLTSTSGKRGQDLCYTKEAVSGRWSF